MGRIEAVPMTAVRVAGKVRKGKLTVKTSVKMPDGEVEVTIVREASKATRDGLSYEELIAHPAFGIWKDRRDMKDSAAYVRKIRRKFVKELRERSAG